MARTSRAEMAYRIESILRSTFPAMFDPAPGERRPVIVSHLGTQRKGPVADATGPASSRFATPPTGGGAPGRTVAGAQERGLCTCWSRFGQDWPWLLRRC